MTTGSCDKDMQESLNANIRDILSKGKQTILYKEADVCFLETLILVYKERNSCLQGSRNCLPEHLFSFKMTLCHYVYIHIWKQTIVYQEADCFQYIYFLI